MNYAKTCLKLISICITIYEWTTIREMGWFFHRKKGTCLEARVGRPNSVSSVSAPPLLLIVIFGIIFLLFWLSSYINYKLQVQLTMINLKGFSCFCLCCWIFAAQSVFYAKKKPVPGWCWRYFLYCINVLCISKFVSSLVWTIYFCDVSYKFAIIRSPQNISVNVITSNIANPAHVFQSAGLKT